MRGNASAIPTIRSTWIAGSGIVLAILAGCGPAKEKKSETPVDVRYPVETAIVAARPLSRRISGIGSLVPFEVVRATARVAGVVEKVLVAEGDRIESGQVVAEIEPERYRLGVESAKASAAHAQAVLDDAASGLKRREDLSRGQPALVKEEELAQFRAKAAQAQADVSAATAALAKAELDLRDARVSAPIAGVIQERLVDTGQYVQPGTAIAILVRSDPLRLRFSVTEEDAHTISVGQAVAFRVRGAEGDHPATVSCVADRADEASRLVPVIAIVAEKAGGDLRAGSFAMVGIEQPKLGDAIIVPEGAVRPSERGFLAYVVVDEAGTSIAHERRLTLGMHTPDGGREVRAGLAAGEALVVRGSESLREGAEVRISNERVEQVKKVEKVKNVEKPDEIKMPATSDPVSPAAASGAGQTGH